MANYVFQNINAGLQIKAPAIAVHQVLDHYDGTADVTIKLSLGNPNSDAVTFSTMLTGFTYSGEWTRADVEAWVQTELVNYEV